MPAPTDDRSGQVRSALSRFVHGDRLTQEELGALSHLSEGPLSELSGAWSSLSPGERVDLVLTLSAAERQDARLDFNAEYALALRDASAEVRASAAASVVDDQLGALLESLLELLHGDADQDVRLAVARALAPYAYRCEVGELPAPVSRKVRAALLRSARSSEESAAVRGAALAGAGYFSDDEVQELVRTLSTESGPLRSGALRAMGRSSNPRWLELLTPALAADDESEREEAARALGEIQDERAVPALAEALEDSDTDVKLAVIRALSEVGGEDAREALFYAHGDPNPRVKEAVVQALEALESQEDPLG